MNARIERDGLSIAPELVQLVNEEIAPGAGVDPDHFWAEFASIINDLAPKNRELLETRRKLQKRVELIHTHWKKDDEYLAPPTRGSLVSIDPGLIVEPPPGLEIGYVAIFTRQEKR